MMEHADSAIAHIEEVSVNLRNFRYWDALDELIAANKEISSLFILIIEHIRIEQSNQKKEVKK